jgi:hypothetical protein
MLSNELQDKAEHIHESSRKTGEQLYQQTVVTKQLMDYARSLVKAVQVFHLQDNESSKSKSKNTKADVVTTDFERKAS